MSQPSHAGVTDRPPHLPGIYVGSEDHTLVMRLEWQILNLSTISSGLFVCLHSCPSGTDMSEARVGQEHHFVEWLPGVCSEKDSGQELPKE